MKLLPKTLNCTGAMCYLRDKCVHHALPTTETKALFWPSRTGDSCEYYESKLSPWGYGSDEECD